MIEFDWLLVGALSCIALAGVTRGIVGFGAGMIIVTRIEHLNDVDIELKAGISLTMDIARSDKVGNIVSKFRPSNKKTPTTKTIIIDKIVK